jgi:hypothetical protein
MDTLKPKYNRFFLYPQATKKNYIIYYIYNMIKNAGSSLGHKHSEETKAKMRMFKHSEEAKAKPFIYIYIYK